MSPVLDNEECQYDMGSRLRITDAPSGGVLDRNGGLVARAAIALDVIPEC